MKPAFGYALLCFSGGTRLRPGCTNAPVRWTTLHSGVSSRYRRRSLRTSLRTNDIDHESEFNSVQTQARRFFPPLHSEFPRSRHAFEGCPSTPGWKSGRLDVLTDWATADEANRPVISAWDPDGLWLWTQWKGTALSLTVFPIVIVMGLGIGVDSGIHALSDATWPLLSVPPADDPLIQQLQGLNKMWGYLLTLGIFILSFFTSQAYDHWKKIYQTTRCIQGRLNDICLLITVGAKRQEDGSGQRRVSFGEREPFTYTTSYCDEAEELVELCTRLVRLSHTFFWAAAPTVSNGVDETVSQTFGDEDEIGPTTSLLSPDGLEGLVDAGQLTDGERDALLRSGLPPSQYAYVLMEWVGLYAIEGLNSGLITCGNGFEENLLRQITSLRAEYFNIGDYAAGRMPLAYVQLVQVIVDSLILLAPFALYSDLGSLSIPLAGLLTLFFKGLLELSKSFLDPFGVEGHPGQNIHVDTLVSELNFGAGSRWVKAAGMLPVPSNVAEPINGGKPKQLH